MSLAAAPSALALPLTSLDGFTVTGAHRFIEIGGRRGFHPLSVKTEAVIETTLHRSHQGTLSLWFSPLEDLSNAPHNQSIDQIPFDFPLIADRFPARNNREVRFGVNFGAAGYPAILARFMSGLMWERMDHGMAPFVYAEKAILRQGYWYHLALTWDCTAKWLAIYINGFEAGHNLRADNFEEPGERLYLGNPMMAFRELRLEPRALSASEVLALYGAGRPSENDFTDADWRKLLEPAFLAPLDFRRDAEWKSALACSFTRAEDLTHWVRQGPGEKYADQLRCETTAEGLWIKTPEPVAIESRMYLWTQRNFEGDQWLEFDFRVESERGLALVVMCASGMQRESFIEDHGVQTTGSMGTILRDLRNYHWEYVRRVEAMRTNVETQYLAKNPFGHKLHLSAIPRFAANRWYRLRFIKAGNRLHGSIDGQTVFDYTDSAFGNNGPVYNFGRIALRQMYHTTLRYRNLEVWERPAGRATKK